MGKLTTQDGSGQGLAHLIENTTIHTVIRCSFETWDKI